VNGMRVGVTQMMKDIELEMWRFQHVWENLVTVLWDYHSSSSNGTPALSLE